MTVENADISEFEYGIYLNSTSDNTIKGNTLTSNAWDGISLYNSARNTLTQNHVLGNGECGIWLMHESDNNIIITNYAENNTVGIRIYTSSNNTLQNNTITSNEQGIWLTDSGNNTLISNRMNANQYNFGVEGDRVQHFTNNVDTSNTINQKPAYYLINKHNLMIPSDANYLALINCTNITVHKLSLTKNIQGILLIHTTNVTVSQCVIRSNYNSGIHLDLNSSKTCIAENMITGNWNGISIYSSHDNRVSGNSVYSNNWSGVTLNCSSNNQIADNNLTKNYDGGIELWSSSNFNNVTRNISESNGDEGIELMRSSSYNSVSQNTLSYDNVGIYILNSSNNQITNNNFIHNTMQTQTYDSTNAWNLDQLSGGNYWTDYAGTDNNADGIGDTPLTIGINNQDNYPLMHRWKLGDVNYDGSINITDLYSIAETLGRHIGHSDWNPRTDLRRDGVINVLDLIIEAQCQKLDTLTTHAIPSTCTTK